MLFDFLLKPSKHIARYKDDGNGIQVSTVFCHDVSDGYNYETAIQHSRYRDGRILPVESYQSIEDAMVGHHKWICIITSDELPEKIINGSHSDVILLAKQLAPDQFEYYLDEKGDLM